MSFQGKPMEKLWEKNSHKRAVERKLNSNKRQAGIPRKKTAEPSCLCHKSDTSKRWTSNLERDMTYKDPTKPETTTESEIYQENKESSEEPEVKR